MTETQPEQVDDAPAIPAGVKMPSDHQKSAAQIEAEGVQTIDVQWRGMVFTVTADADDWEVQTTLAFEEGKAATGVRGVLGKEQWATLMETRPKNRDLGDLFNEVAKALGMDNSGN